MWYGCMSTYNYCCLKSSRISDDKTPVFVRKNRRILLHLNLESRKRPNECQVSRRGLCSQCRPRDMWRLLGNRSAANTPRNCCFPKESTLITLSNCDAYMITRCSETKCFLIHQSQWCYKTLPVLSHSQWLVTACQTQNLQLVSDFLENWNVPLRTCLLLAKKRRLQSRWRNQTYPTDYHPPAEQCQYCRRDCRTPWYRFDRQWCLSSTLTDYPAWTLR